MESGSWTEKVRCRVHVGLKILPSPRSTLGTSTLSEFQSHGNLTPLVTLQLLAFYRPEKQNKPRKM